MPDSTLMKLQFLKSMYSIFPVPPVKNASVVACASITNTLSWNSALEGPAVPAKLTSGVGAQEKFPIQQRSSLKPRIPVATSPANSNMGAVPPAAAALLFSMDTSCNHKSCGVPEEAVPALKVAVIVPVAAVPEVPKNFRPPISQPAPDTRTNSVSFTVAEAKPSKVRPL